MMSDLQSLKGELEKNVSATLSRQALANRAKMQPFRLPGVARDLIAGLLATDGTTSVARDLGRSLNEQGMGLASLIEAQATVLELIAEVDLPPATIGNVSRFFGWLFEGFSAAEAAESMQQQAQMERAFRASIEQQREHEEQLRSAISELSTPIFPVYEGILVLPLVGSIDSRRANEITERLLEALVAYQADIVIIDITGVPMMDTNTADHLLRAARAAELLGSQVVLVGIGTEIAQTIVHIGISLGNLVTLANLQAGIAYALDLRGLGIQAL